MDSSRFAGHFVTAAIMAIIKSYIVNKLHVHCPMIGFVRRGLYEVVRDLYDVSHDKQSLVMIIETAIVCRQLTIIRIEI